MLTSLQGIAKKAQGQKRYRFRNLYGMLNEALLTESWREIKKHAAYGVDQIRARRTMLTFRSFLVIRCELVGSWVRHRSIQECPRRGGCDVAAGTGA